MLEVQVATWVTILRLWTSSVLVRVLLRPTGSRIAIKYYEFSNLS